MLCCVCLFLMLYLHVNLLVDQSSLHFSASDEAKEKGKKGRKGKKGKKGQCVQGSMYTVKPV